MKKKLVIVGGGACALMLGCQLDNAKYEISIFEKNAALGRKFLVAGEGGLNLTHSENSKVFLSRYSPSTFLEKAFTHFSNHDLVKWINELGIETYVGSSGRVFPRKGIKPIEVLNTILKKIEGNNVSLCTRHEWRGFSSEGKLIFEHGGKSFEITSDRVIFCLGGASWSVTGSAGDWTKFFTEKGIRVNPFKSSNCAFQINWGNSLVSKIEGKVLKNISISCGNKTQFGEVVITRFGMEGGGIYALSPVIREELDIKQEAGIGIDFKPDLSLQKIREQISKPFKTNFTQHLKTQLNLSDVQLALLKHFLTKEIFLNTHSLSNHIKNFKLLITGLAPLDEAISTIGGIDKDEADPEFQLKKLPNHFVIGEMLDYDAPTGGYLLQSCFSMGKYLADHLNAGN